MSRERLATRDCVYLKRLCILDGKALPCLPLLCDGDGDGMLCERTAIRRKFRNKEMKIKVKGESSYTHSHSHSDFKVSPADALSDFD